MPLPKCKKCGRIVSQEIYEEFLSDVDWENYICQRCRQRKG